MKCYVTEKKVGPPHQRQNNSSAKRTGRQTQITHLFAVSFVVALLFASPASGQQQQCLVCRNHQCQFSGFVGGCACTETINGGCATCGTCIGVKCEVECAAKIPPTRDQLQAHTWMVDNSLPGKVTAHSQALGHLLGQEQKLLKLGWCSNFRRGEDFAVRDDKSTEYKWELIPRSGDIDEYRVKSINDGKEEKIILMKAHWIILGGDDFGDLIARGDIASVKAPQ